MYMKAVINSPDSEQEVHQIHKDIAAFLCATAVAYIEMLKLSDEDISFLYTGISEDIDGITAVGDGNVSHKCI